MIPSTDVIQLILTLKTTTARKRQSLSTTVLFKICKQSHFSINFGPLLNWQVRFLPMAFMFLSFTNLLKRVIFGRLTRAVNMIAELLPSLERIECFLLLENNSLEPLEGSSTSCIQESTHAQIVESKASKKDHLPMTRETVCENSDNPEQLICNFQFLVSRANWMSPANILKSFFFKMLVLWYTKIALLWSPVKLAVENQFFWPQ